MLDLLIALAATAQDTPATATPGAAVPQAVPAAATAPTLKAIPGVTINYYDVAGTNDKEIRKSIAAQRPKGADGEPIPAGTTWEINANVTKRTENGKCTIVSVTPTFAGTAVLPRLATPGEVKPELLTQWNSYVSNLESSAAAHLDFVHDRLDNVKQAVTGTDCDAAGAALDAAIERLKTQETAFLAQQAALRAAEQAKALEARKAAENAARENRENPSYDPKTD